MDKTELVAALDQLSELPETEARAQKMELGAQAMREYLHPTRPPAEPENPPTPINRKSPTPWAKPESEHNDA